MRLLRYATAGQTVMIGPIVDGADGYTPETGFTPANTDVFLFKEGASAVVNKNSGGLTHMSNGMFVGTFDSADTNTLGNMQIVLQMAGARPVVVECAVVAQGVYDDMYNASGGVWEADLDDFVNVGTAGYTLNKMNNFAEMTEVTLFSVIEGATITVQNFDSWEIPIPNLPDLSGYTSVLFAVKPTAATEDLLAQLFVRSDTGLITVGGVAADASGNGDVTVSAGNDAVTVEVDITETGKSKPGNYTWWLKAFDSVATEGVTIATGLFNIEAGGAHATS